MYTQKMTCRVRRDLGTMIRPVKHTGDDPCRVVDTPVNQLQGQVPATDAQVLLAPHRHGDQHMRHSIMV
jgi:hypothetical protein